MDIVRTQNKSFYQRYKYFLWGALLLSLAGFSFYQSDWGTYSIAKSSLLIAEVEKGDFVVKVRAPGTLAPRDIRWISSRVAGRAERVWIKPGAKVKAGDLLFELTNPTLMRTLEEITWELEAQEAETRAELVNLESQLLDQSARVFNAKLDFETISMRLKAESSLFESGAQVVSTLDHARTKLEAQQMAERWKIEQARFSKMEEKVAAQKLALAARLKKMRKTLQSQQEKVDNLKIYASIDSVIQDIAIESGQRVQIGTNLAKLAKQDDLIAELKIPELLIKEVALDQLVTIDTRNNVIQGKVSRIAPSVSANTVQVDVELMGDLPKDARPDLSVDAEIIVAEIKESLFIQRPHYAQSHRNLSVFKLDATGNSASRTTISLGQGSARQIEIKEGLNVGERIIISEHDELKRFDHISLN